MSDYIKREDAKDAVINIVGWEKIAKYVDEMSKHFSTKDNEYYDALMDAEDAIDDLPSADVAPVRHGRWAVGYGGNGWNDWYIFECPLCGIKIEDRNGRGMDWEYNYCPNCGARMDGEKDD